MRVLLTFPFVPDDWHAALTAAAPNCDVVLAEPGSDFYATTLPTAEVVLGHVPLGDLPKAKALKWWSVPYAGVGKLVPYVPESVLLTNAAGAFGQTIAEHALAMLLALTRSVPAMVRLQDQGQWNREPDARTVGALAPGFACRVLSGGTLGILGLGDIGQSFANLVAGFGFETWAYKRTPTNPMPERVGTIHTDLTAVDLALADTDVLFNALPGTDHTDGLLDADRLAKLKPGAIVLNVGRGSTMDHDALAVLLASGHLGGAGLDVTDPEPLPQDHPLWTTPNTLISPHVSGQSKLCGPAIFKQMQDNLRLYANGQTQAMANVVDKAFGY